MLKGNRHSSHRLWDIPIKSNIQSNKFQMPSISPGLHQIKKSTQPMKVLMDVILKILLKISRCYSERFHSIPEHMKPLDPLLD